MTESEFDNAVAALRGAVPPKQISRGMRKKDATPAEWASHLDAQAERRLKDPAREKLYRKAQYARDPEKYRQKSRLWRKSNPAKHAEQNRRYAKRNREVVTARNAKWRQANPDKVSEYHRRYRERHRLKIKTRLKKWCEDNKEKLLAYQRRKQNEYYHKNKELCKSRNKAWKQANRAQVAAYQKKYYAVRLADDPVFKIEKNLRSRLGQAVKGKSSGVSAVRHHGLPKDLLRSWIEANWGEGMSWDNYGRGAEKWSVDHVYPLKAPGIDLRDECHVLAVSNWRNLRPMWNGGNTRKRNQIVPEAKALFEELVQQFLEMAKHGVPLDDRASLVDEAALGEY